jgi:hypothetical protein
MKALIIILALVGVSFIGLVVWGQTRHDQPAAAAGCKRISDPKNVPDDWCPPKLAELTTPLQAKFAPDLGTKPAEVSFVSGPFPATFSVVKSDKSMRAAHIELVAGDYAILASQSNGDSGNGKLCLCRQRPGLMDADLLSANCPGTWTKKHLEPAKKTPARTCLADDIRGILAFDGKGGTIKLVQGTGAKVRIE